MQELADKQDDPRAETMLSWELEKVLAALQPQEINEIQNILTQTKTETRTTTASGDRSVAIGGDVSSTTIITGDRNKTEKGE